MPLTTSNMGSLSLVVIGIGSVCLFTVWYIVSAVATWYRLRHVPGPYLASFSHMWMAKAVLFNTLYEDLKSLGKYGGLARIGPSTIVTSDPDVLRRIASARTKYLKSKWYSAATFSPEHNTMITALDNYSHDKLKAKTAKGYSGRENPDLEIAVNSQVARLIETIRRKHLTTKSRFCDTEFASLSRYFTLDVITRLAYGEPFGFLDADNLYGYIRGVDKSTKAMTLSQEIPFFRQIVFSRTFFRLFGPRPSDERGVGKIMG